MGEPVTVFEFADRLRPGSVPVVNIVDLKRLEPLIPRAELEATFYGLIQYCSDSGEIYRGVWGGRNASKLRQMLRARGATVIIERRSPEARLQYVVTKGKQRALDQAACVNGS